MPWLPRHTFLDWPEDKNQLPVDEVIKMYESGFAGAKFSQDALDQFAADQPEPDGEAVARKYGLADTGAGKLVIPYVFVMEMFPGCYPGPAQERGDCVSHGAKNASLITMCCDIVSGLPDEKTGKPEQPPEVSEEGIRNGVLSSEAFYWHRGYNGDGWMCAAAANVATKKSGLFVRKNYPELGVDLTKYSGRNAGLYGSRAPGAEIQKVGSEHLIHAATEVTTFESRRDFAYNGFGLIDCGGEGYSDRRDENGVSVQSGSWAHSMCEIGVDDRDVIKQKYGQPLVLIMNSWGNWNSGGRDIYQSSALVPSDKKDLWVQRGIVNASTGNIMIPEGSFWAKWSHVKNREVFAFNGALGWAKKELPWLQVWV